METSLYGDQDYSSVYRLPQMENVQQLKKRMTLDLDTRPGKRQRLDPLLTSPDVNMLKLASPELERFITQHGLATTPTPGNAINPVFGRPATEEQENYARGFVDALHHLKQQEQQDTAVAVAQYADVSPVYTTLESGQGCGGMPAAVTTAPASLPGQYYGLPSGVQIKEEPQTVPSLSSHSSSPQPHSPVDMVEQERIKLERKRLRNRVAATKCRKRKLERIARLEERVQQIKNENSELAAVAGRLREQVMALKREVQHHTQSGCQILQPR